MVEFPRLCYGLSFQEAIQVFSPPRGTQRASMHSWLFPKGISAHALGQLPRAATPVTGMNLEDFFFLPPQGHRLGHRGHALSFRARARNAKSWRLERGRRPHEAYFTLSSSCSEWDNRTAMKTKCCCCAEH